MQKGWEMDGREPGQPRGYSEIRGRVGPGFHDSSGWHWRGGGTDRDWVKLVNSFSKDLPSFLFLSLKSSWEFDLKDKNMVTEAHGWVY